MTNFRNHPAPNHLDVEGLLILLTFLATGLIPVIAMIATGPMAEYGTDLGFAVVIAAAIVIARELAGARRRRGRNARHDRAPRTDVVEDRDD